MVSETDFYNVLKDIAVSLRRISENMKTVAVSRKMESDQVVKESRMRIRNGKFQRMVSESSERKIV